MSKASSKRTSPPDRDGDGKPGGSLPGNETVPEAKGPAPETAPEDETPAAIKDRARPVSDEHRHAEPAETAPAETETSAETAPAETDLFGGPEEQAEVEEALAETETPAETAATDPSQLHLGEGDFGGGDSPDEGEPEWTRDNAAIFEDLQLVDEGWAIDRLTLEAVVGWPDEQAHEAQKWAEAMATRAEDDAVGAPPPEFLKAFMVGSEPEATCRVCGCVENRACVVEGEPCAWAEPDLCTACVGKEAPAEPDPSETFSAEEIAAGKTPVVGEEGETVEPTAAEAAPPVSADGLVTLESDDPRQPSVAVRLADLRRLVDNRWLYKTKDGYSPSYSAPWVSPEDVAVWVKAGLAEDRPTAGREGGVFVTAKAQRLVGGRAA